MTKENTLDYIIGYTSDFNEEKVFVERLLTFVNSNDDFYSRKNLLGHITGSSWILSPDQQDVLLIHHNKLNRWFQPGGHTEHCDKTIAETSLREGIEETGLSELVFINKEIFDIDIHTIPAKKGVPEHVHYDIRFIFQAQSKLFSQNMQETSGIKWIPYKAILEDNGFDQSLKRMAKKTALYITKAEFKSSTQ